MWWSKDSDQGCDMNGRDPHRKSELLVEFDKVREAPFSA